MKWADARSESHWHYARKKSEPGSCARCLSGLDLGQCREERKKGVRKSSPYVGTVGSRAPNPMDGVRRWRWPSTARLLALLKKSWEERARKLCGALKGAPQDGGCSLAVAGLGVSGHLGDMRTAVEASRGKWLWGWRAFPTVFALSKDYPKRPILKFTNVLFMIFEIHETFWDDPIDIMEQLSFLAPLPNPSEFQIRKCGSNSNFKLAWILKGFKPSGKNPRNFINFSFHILFQIMNLNWLTCMRYLEDP
jgi:hypothetical protein